MNLFTAASISALLLGAVVALTAGIVWLYDTYGDTVTTFTVLGLVFFLGFTIFLYYGGNR